jgi:hypothetical protein
MESTRPAQTEAGNRPNVVVVARLYPISAEGVEHKGKVV